MEIPFLILAVIAAFIYTLVASIRNSSRIKSLEREVHGLKRLMATGAASPLAAQAEADAAAENPDFRAEEENRALPEEEFVETEYPSET